MAHLVLLFCLAANGAAERLVNTPQGDAIPVETYVAEGRGLLLWQPHELGATPRRVTLAQRLADRGIEVEDKPVEFPVLMDRDGEALRRWGVYAFPTTLVLDREHRIRYAVFGAFDWSSGEVVGKLRTLLSDRTRTADQGPR